MIMGSTRSLREKYALICTVCLVLATTSTLAELPFESGEPPLVIIDMHTHIFNGHDLPLSGILSARGAPLNIARHLAKLLNAWTQNDITVPLLRSDAFPRAMALNTESIREEAANELASTTPAGTGDSLFAPLTVQEREELLEFVGEQDVRYGTTRSPGPGEEVAAPADDVARSPAIPTDRPDELEVVAAALAKIGFPPSEEAESNARETDEIDD
jgi:hypothetical protein